jgi:hypothetical protein
MESDIWSQASYRNAILWEAFLDTSDSYFLFAEEREYHKYHRWALARSSSCLFKQFEKYAYMFNVYKNQQQKRQTGSRNLMGTKTLPTIWYTYMMLGIFLSNYWWQESDIWSQASYRNAILWEAFLDTSDSYFLFAEEREYHKYHRW